MRTFMMYGMLLIGFGLIFGWELIQTRVLDLPTGDRLLVTAVAMSDAPAATRALGGGAAPDALSVAGMPAIFFAVDMGDASLVREFIARGADPNVTTDRGWTPIAIAALRVRHPRVIQALLDAGADPNPQQGPGASAAPLVAAVQSGNDAAIELLLRHGADVNRGTAGGQTPLTAAAGSESMDLDVVWKLIAAGADVNAPDDTGITPLQAAASAGRADIAAMLEHHSRSVNASKADSFK